MNLGVRFTSDDTDVVPLGTLEGSRHSVPVDHVTSEIPEMFSRMPGRGHGDAFGGRRNEHHLDQWPFWIHAAKNALLVESTFVS